EGTAERGRQGVERGATQPRQRTGLPGVPTPEHQLSRRDDAAVPDRPPQPPGDVIARRAGPNQEGAEADGAGRGGEGHDVAGGRRGGVVEEAAERQPDAAAGGADVEERGPAAEVAARLPSWVEGGKSPGEPQHRQRRGRSEDGEVAVGGGRREVEQEGAGV